MDPKDLPQGGPAFPTSNAHQNGPSTFHFEGMTLRDYFAAKAMQSISSDADFLEELRRMRKPIAQSVATAAYAMADAMLEVRQ